MPKQGFLGTSAPFGADVTLLIEVAMALALLFGMLLARRRRYRAHGWCQSAVVLLNVFVIAQFMVPSFRSHVAPKIPARLGRPFYALATSHAAVGCIAELLAIFIVLSAGTNILPARLRLVHYKRWMRTSLLIWWLTLLLGIATYVRWYPPGKGVGQQKGRTSSGFLVPERSARLLWPIRRYRQGTRSNSVMIFAPHFARTRWAMTT